MFKLQILVDRISINGNITTHWTENGARTMCGRTLELTQPYSENRPCKICERLGGKWEGQ